MCVLRAVVVILHSPRSMLCYLRHVIVFLWFMKTSLLLHINWPCRLHLPRSVLADVFPSSFIFPTTDLIQLPLSYFPIATLRANYSSCPVSAATCAWSADVPSSHACASHVPVSAATSSTPVGTANSDTCANHPCGHSPLPHRTAMFASRHPSAGTWNGPNRPQTHQCSAVFVCFTGQNYCSDMSCSFLSLFVWEA